MFPYYDLDTTQNKSHLRIDSPCTLLWSPKVAKTVSTAQSVNHRTFLQYPTWPFKILKSCMLYNSVPCQLPRQSFKPANIYYSIS